MAQSYYEPSWYDESSMNKDVQQTCKISIKVKNRGAFGNLCVALTSDHVPFDHRGHQTILVRETELAHLPAESGRLFDELKAHSLIEISQVNTASRRRLASEEETKELLRKYTARRKDTRT